MLNHLKHFCSFFCRYTPLFIYILSFFLIFPIALHAADDLKSLENKITILSIKSKEYNGSIDILNQRVSSSEESISDLKNETQLLDDDIENKYLITSENINELIQSTNDDYDKLEKSINSIYQTLIDTSNDLEKLLKKIHEDGDEWRKK
jgi:DNA repair ATPase RecN